MGKKRRTKKDKINPKHSISISWDPDAVEAKKPSSEANVKRQLPNEKSRIQSSNRTLKLAKDTEKNDSLASVKKDLIKSLVFASLLIASEVVIYLFWY